MGKGHNKSKFTDKRVMVATIASTGLWIVSIVLAFIIKAGDKFAFVPDLLLLLGFFPVLALWRRGWLTLLFGLLNTFIGFFLLILQYLDDDLFQGPMQMMRHHLISMHSCWTWILLGLVALIWGAVSTSISLVRWIQMRGEKAKVEARVAKITK